MSANQIFSNLLRWESPICIWYLEVSSLHGLALFFVVIYVVSLAKLLLNFMLEKRYVLIEMPLVLFKIATQIHFIYHVQAQTIGLQLS